MKLLKTFHKPVLIATTLAIVITTLGVVQTAHAQGTPKPQESPATKVTASTQKQWEYLVISFGKTYFSGASDADAKKEGYSKLLSYSQAGIVVAQEALVTQKQMDTLGRFGWELVGIVGAIGGDQEMLFKRPYDPNQSKREAALIREEGERLLAARKEADARLSKAASEPTEELVDLDAVELAAATAETQRKEEARLNEAILSVKDYPAANVTVGSNASDPKGSNVRAIVIIDGTQTLLKDGNKYRASEAGKMAGNAALAYYTAAGLKQKFRGLHDLKSGFYTADVKIIVTITVSYQGKPKVVAVENVGGDWPERAN